MIFKNKRGIGETILIAFMTLLLLLGLYSFFVYHLQIQLLLVIMVVAEAGLLYFYFFGTQYELTDDALILRERKPFRDKRIAYDTIRSYRIGGRSLGRIGRIYDLYLTYEESGKKHVLILTPEDRDEFVKELRQHCRRALDED